MCLGDGDNGGEGRGGVQEVDDWLSLSWERQKGGKKR